MARSDIVPLDQIARRAPEAGRIRIGVKTAKAMKSIDTFRFTSPHERLIRQLAEMYGGTPKPWEEPRARVKNQYEVITETNSIPVYLPANGLSTWYELWSGGGCLRRCDGITVRTVAMHGEEAVPEESDCICVAKNQRECRPYTRLNVVLPELPFAGTWRLESKGWNAAQELPGMFDMVRALDERGQMLRALLGVERRSDIVGGKTRNFVVPTLSVEESPMQIEQGQANVGALNAGGTRALPRTDDDDRMLARASDPIDEPIAGEIVSAEEMQLRELLADDASEHGLDPERFLTGLSMIDGGIAEHGERVHQDIASGKRTPIGFDASGKIRWRKEEAE